jgi:hypothetical protein
VNKHVSDTVIFKRNGFSDFKSEISISKAFEMLWEVFLNRIMCLLGQAFEMLKVN